LQQHAADPDAHFYSSSRGDAGVRKAIAKYFKGRFGVELDPDTQICVVLGGKEGLSSSLGRAFVNPGDVRCLSFACLSGVRAGRDDVV
jgi:alanine-synthesizing transaminase